MTIVAHHMKDTIPTRCGGTPTTQEHYVVKLLRLDAVDHHIGALGDSWFMVDTLRSKCPKFFL